jgi:hypothetical protein
MIDRSDARCWSAAVAPALLVLLSGCPDWDALSSAGASCASPAAVTLTPGQKTTVTGDTSTAVNEFGASITCIDKLGPLGPFAGPQLYYKLSLSGGKTYRVELSTPKWDGAIYLFTDTTCQVATIESQCANLASDSGAAGDLEALIVSPTADTTYILAVDSTSATDSGAFIVTIKEGTSPENDVCTAAAPLSLGATVSGDTTFAKDDVTTTACLGDTPGNDVFYRVTLNPGKTYTVTLTSPASFDAAVYAFTSCATPDTTCVGGADDNAGAETFKITPSATTDYWIAVDSFDTLASGSFTLTVQ